LKKNLNPKLKKIKLLVMDVDGVMTAGQIAYDHLGNEIKFFNVLDGFAIVLFRKEGFKTAILSARFSAAVQVRGEDLKVDKIVQDAYPKLEAYKKLARELGVKDDEVCFIADDLPDLAVLKQVGLAVAPANAVPEVKKIAHYVTAKKGGDGAVREIIELILKAHGRWPKIMKAFS